MPQVLRTLRPQHYLQGALAALVVVVVVAAVAQALHMVPLAATRTIIALVVQPAQVRDIDMSYSYNKIHHYYFNSIMKIDNWAAKRNC